MFSRDDNSICAYYTIEETELGQLRNETVDVFPGSQTRTTYPPLAFRQRNHTKGQNACKRKVITEYVSSVEEFIVSQKAKPAHASYRSEVLQQVRLTLMTHFQVVVSIKYSL